VPIPSAVATCVPVPESYQPGYARHERCCANFRIRKTTSVRRGLGRVRLIVRASPIPPGKRFAPLTRLERLRPGAVGVSGTHKSRHARPWLPVHGDGLVLVTPMHPLINSSALLGRPDAHSRRERVLPSHILVDRRPPQLLLAEVRPPNSTRAYSGLPQQRTPQCEVYKLVKFKMATIETKNGGSLACTVKPTYRVDGACNATLTHLFLGGRERGGTISMRRKIIIPSTPSCRSLLPFGSERLVKHAGPASPSGRPCPRS
jgi:hypothetical protein